MAEWLFYIIMKKADNRQGGPDMEADMKNEIAKAARNLLSKKGVKKLTVKDIVEECHITRQTFYYYFENIPEMFRWMMEQSTEEFLKKSHGDGSDVEAGMRDFFLMAIHARGDLEKMMASNYRDELAALIKNNFYRILERIVEEKNLYQDLSRFQLKWLLKYHSNAVMGILAEWTDEDTKNLDRIVHELYLITRKSLRDEP